MSWQYRVIRGVEGDPPVEWYGVVEYYCFGNPPRSAWSERPIIVGDSLEELLSTWGMLAEAFEMPVLDEAQLLSHGVEVAS